MLPRRCRRSRKQPAFGARVSRGRRAARCGRRSGCCGTRMSPAGCAGRRERSSPLGRRCVGPGLLAPHFRERLEVAWVGSVDGGILALLSTCEQRQPVGPEAGAVGGQYRIFSAGDSQIQSRKSPAGGENGGGSRLGRGHRLDPRADRFLPNPQAAVMSTMTSATKRWRSASGSNRLRRC